MTTAVGSAFSLADTLTGVWADQGRIGFLLTDPEDDSIEIRRTLDPVSQVNFRFRWLPHRELRTNVAELEARGILDAGRNETVLFRDERDPSGRFCFLCPANIRECNPKEELVPIELAGRRYYAGANFAWISRDHFTVLAADHVGQRFTDHTLNAMLDLHRQTDGRFRVVYNGPYAGATIPWHLHYQITSERFPVEALPVGREADYPTALQRFSGVDAAQTALARADAWMERDREHHQVNVLVAGPTSLPQIHLLPRDTRRSHAAQKGLMGGFELCGDFIYSEPDKRGEFERATSETARSMLAEVRPAEA